MAGPARIEVSFMWPDAGGYDAAHRSYGKSARKVQRLVVALAVGCLAVAWTGGEAGAASRPIKIVALGDSLTAGHQLPASASFPVQLEKALKAKGHAVAVVNAGVSGDTSSGGLARLDWSVPEGSDAVILELGANDMLRGVDPKVTRAALETIIRRLKERRIEVLLCGMLAAPNLGPDFARAFNKIYPELAAANDLTLYPFFLDGVAGNRKLNLGDGLHPTAEGVAAIVARILPKVEAVIARVQASVLTYHCHRRGPGATFIGAAVIRRPASIGQQEQELTDAAAVHWPGNPLRLGAIAFHAARRAAGRALDRS